MSYIEELRKSKDKAQVAYSEFVLLTRRFPAHLFCFFEGKDNAYYVPRVKQVTNNYRPILCGGREKVLGVYRLITNRREYANYKKAFFIDRDFNSSLPAHNPPIFETPCYSIENLYTSINVFKEILINELHLSEVSDSSFEICMQLFAQRQQEFHLAVCLLNAWYACLIDRRNAERQETGVNLDDKLPKGFVEFSLQGINQRYNLETIKNTFPNALEIAEEKLKAKYSEFSSCEQRLVFRGKYELQFLITMIDLIIKDSLTEQQFFKSKIDFSFYNALNNEKAINVFSGYAETPENLLTYIKQVIDNKT